MSERDPEMMERWCAYHTSSVGAGKDMRGLDEIVADFARAEVRRELVEELERLRRKALIDDRLRELHVETEQGPASPVPTEKAASMPLAGRGLERREPGSIPGAMSAGREADGNSGETKARARAGAYGAEESAADSTHSPAQTAAKDAGSTPARQIADLERFILSADLLREDWLAMMRHIALHLGDEEDRDFAGDADFAEQFDPWECVRLAGKRLQEQSKFAAATPAPGTTCYWSQPSEDSDLELRTKELLRRILQGALDQRAFESLRTQARREKFEDEIRALLAEWEARRG